jgi:hypothetical protein
LVLTESVRESRAEIVHSFSYAGIQVVDVDTTTPEPEPEPKKKKGKGGKKKGKKGAAPPPRDFIYIHSNPMKEFFSLLESLQARDNRLTKALAAASDDVDVHPNLLAKVPCTPWIL